MSVYVYMYNNTCKKACKNRIELKINFNFNLNFYSAEKRSNPKYGQYARML
jgi:hypothetical protein